MLREFVTFDVETTGLHPVTARVIELAAVRWCEGEVVGAFHTLVNPGVPIPPESYAIHGISDAQAGNAPAIEDALRLFELFRGELPLAAHNAPFDTGFLAMEAVRAQVQLKSARVLDTLMLARDVFPEEASHRLERLAKSLGLQAEQHHRALADAETAGRLLLRAIERAGEPAVSMWSEWAPGSFAAEHHPELAAAIAGQTLVQVLYPNKNDIPVAWHMRPLGVVQVYNQTYLHGFCPDVGDARTFRMDKVLSVELPQAV